MRSLHNFGVSLALCALCAARVDAGLILTPTDQLRETEVLADITGEGSVSDADFDTAPGFGPFTSSIDAAVQAGPPEDPVTASSDGSQSSAILTAMISASGLAHAECSLEDAGFLPDSSGRSFFSVTFDLDDATEYKLGGVLNAAFTNGGAPLANVHLSSTLDGTIYFLDTTDGAVPILAGGLLPAGEYTLSALAEAIADPSDRTADASFNLEFELVPEPGAAGLLLIGALAARRGARRNR